MSEQRIGVDRRMGEGIDPNILLMMANSTIYFEKLLALHKSSLETQLKEAVEASRRERAAEIDRTNANRAGDIANVALANDRAIKQAELLNAQMMDTAETMRKSVEQTAMTIANQFEKMTNEQNARLAALERVNNENIGKATATPDWRVIVDQLRDANNIQKGASKGSRDMWGWVSAGLILIIAVIGFVSKW